MLAAKVETLMGLVEALDKYRAALEALEASKVSKKVAKDRLSKMMVEIGKIFDVLKKLAEDLLRVKEEPAGA